MSCSAEIGHLEADNETVKTLMFDSSALAEGIYDLDIALFQCDDAKNSIVIDRVSRACSIEIAKNEADGLGLNWDHRCYGSVTLPMLTVID